MTVWTVLLIVFAYRTVEDLISAGHLWLLKLGHERQAARKDDADKERLRVETELKATLETLKARGDLEAVAMRQPLLDAITAEGKNTEERFALYYEEVMKRMEPTERESLKRLLAS